MPLYPFACACGHQFDVICRVSQEPDPACPRCRGRADRVLTVPRIVTEKTFAEQHSRLLSDRAFSNDKAVELSYTHHAKRAGVRTRGRYYVHGLADYPGDPFAFVDSKAEIKKKCETRGYGCEALGVKPRPPKPLDLTPHWHQPGGRPKPRPAVRPKRKK